MAKMTITQLISRLPPEHQKDVHVKAKKINAARAKARQHEKRTAKEGAKQLLAA